MKRLYKIFLIFRVGHLLIFLIFHIWYAEVIHRFSYIVIEALLVDVEIKAKGYKKVVFSAVFLLNNYHYIFKSLKSSELSDAIESTVLSQISRLLSKQMDIYKSTYVIALIYRWVPCVQFLMDSTNIQDGAIDNSLNVKQRDGIKERFKVRLIF